MSVIAGTAKQSKFKPRDPSALTRLRMTLSVTTFVMTFLSASVSMATDDEIGGYEAAEKARRAHELASSDMIYQQEEWKALYYQNIQIIQLLKEIRDSLQIQNERAAKAGQTP